MLVPAIFDTVEKTWGLSLHMTGRYSVFQIWRNRNPSLLLKMMNKVILLKIALQFLNTNHIDIYRNTYKKLFLIPVQVKNKMLMAFSPSSAFSISQVPWPLQL